MSADALAPGGAATVADELSCRHAPIGVLRRGAGLLRLDRCVARCSAPVVTIDVLRALDPDALQELSIVVVDDVADLSTDEARELVVTFAPLPVVGVQRAPHDDDIVALTTAGFVSVSPVAALDVEVLHDLALAAESRATRHRIYASASEREAIMRDRARIAQDLHDQVIQQLFCLGLDIERLTAVDPGLRERSMQLARRLDGAIDDLRYAIGTLRSGTQPILAQRFKRLVEDAASLSGRSLHYSVRGEVERIEGDLGPIVASVLREALANAVRHSDGPINVSLAIDSHVELVVRNSAPSVVITRRDHAGLGLDSLAARAAALGGDSELTTMTDGSVELRWRVPLHR